MATTDIDTLAINTIRGLAMDMPQAANSGHPGTAMALAPLTHVLWSRIMEIDPTEPDWFDRDRFVLSCGHASPLIYSMLHLAGYAVTVDDLKNFRQFGSLTPGHPEFGHTQGLEVTTGPLGQGFANGVGLGIAEAWMRARFSPDLVNHYTFVLCSDGDLEEGISHEAASLAGHLGLGRLIYVYDDNHISIDGPTELSLSDDAIKRFDAYGWHTENLGEIANDCDALESAVRNAMSVTDKPSFLALRSHIGYPSPKFTDTSKAHGEPLGVEEVAVVKEIMGMPNETFYVPSEVTDWYKETLGRHIPTRKAWQTRVDASPEPEIWDACMRQGGVEGWETKLPTWEAGEKIATRTAIADAINGVADVVPSVMGGGADLTGNTGTKLENTSQFTGATPEGRQVFFGIREHAMGAIVNGMAYHGGVIPMGGTFFVFSDYMRGAVRLAALSNINSTFIWTHDSVGLGEDGPTHQPIEHLAGLRAMPGLTVIRPADANETSGAWACAVGIQGPTALILSRQKLPVLDGTADHVNNVSKGAYVLESADNPKVTLVGTGSEVQVCVEAAATLREQGITTQVVSMPSWELFEQQSETYRTTVLPASAKTVSVEAASTFGWDRYADAMVGIDRFGASAPEEVAMDKLGINAAHVVEVAKGIATKE